jgi:lysyl-tRNA synthetase class 2
MAHTTVVETFRPRGSSHIDEATYNPDTEELSITFTSGDTYTYSNVPAETYSGLTRAGSAGQYFHRQIKGQFDYEQQ